jgi:translation elongation factor P/translation initiation factor 5A
VRYPLGTKKFNRRGQVVAISTSDFKTGLTIEYEGTVYQVLEFQHVKPGKGGAFVRSRLRNLITGNTLEKTWRAGDKMDSALVERRNVEFQYRDGSDFMFMDMSDFEQVQLTPSRYASRPSSSKTTPGPARTWKAPSSTSSCPEHGLHRGP